MAFVTSFGLINITINVKAMYLFEALRLHAQDQTMLQQAVHAQL